MATQNQLSLERRPCKMSGHINVRTEREGDEGVGACDIKISGVMLDREELGKLLGDEHAWRGMFNQKGKVYEPLFPQLADYRLLFSFEKCSVTLWLGLADERESERFNDVKLKSVVLAPQTGGMTAVSVQMQCRPDADQLAKLYCHLETDAHCSMRFGKVADKVKEQPQLPLGEATDASVSVSEATSAALN